MNKTDCIHLFYTEKCKRIDLDIIHDHGDAELITHKVPCGNQSADIHLSSYLGYLIGTQQGSGHKYVIVSNDAGFDHIIDFWKTETGAKAARAQKIGESERQEPTTGRTRSSRKTRSVKKQQPADLLPDTEETKIQQVGEILTRAGMSGDVVDYVTQVVEKNVNNKNKKQQIYRTIISKYRQEQGRQIYNHIRKQI